MTARENQRLPLHSWSDKLCNADVCWPQLVQPDRSGMSRARCAFACLFGSAYESRFVPCFSLHFPCLPGQITVLVLRVNLTDCVSAAFTRFLAEQLLNNADLLRLPSLSLHRRARDIQFSLNEPPSLVMFDEASFRCCWPSCLDSS